MNPTKWYLIFAQQLQPSCASFNRSKPGMLKVINEVMGYSAAIPIVVTVLIAGATFLAVTRLGSTILKMVAGVAGLAMLLTMALAGAFDFLSPVQC